MEYVINMEKENKKFYVIGTLMIALLMVGAIVGHFGNNIDFDEETEIIYVDDKPEWTPITGDGDPGGDTSGFMYGMNYPHSGTPATTYASNLSNATAYEFSDSLDAEMTGETPYNTAYDKVFKYRVNDTVAYDTSNSSWRIDWVRAYLTVDFTSNADFSDQAMEVVHIGNNTDFMWFHVYLQDSDGGAGSGFTITHGETFKMYPLMEGYY